MQHHDINTLSNNLRLINYPKNQTSFIVLSPKASFAFFLFLNSCYILCYVFFPWIWAMYAFTISIAYIVCCFSDSIINLLVIVSQISRHFVKVKVSLKNMYSSFTHFTHFFRFLNVLFRSSLLLAWSPLKLPE